MKFFVIQGTLSSFNETPEKKGRYLVEEGTVVEYDGNYLIPVRLQGEIQVLDLSTGNIYEWDRESQTWGIIGQSQSGGGGDKASSNLTLDYEANIVEQSRKISITAYYDGDGILTATSDNNNINVSVVNNIIYVSGVSVGTSSISASVSETAGYKGSQASVNITIIEATKLSSNLVANTEVIKMNTSSEENISVTYQGNGILSVISSSADITTSISGNIITVTSSSETTTGNITISVSETDTYYGDEIVIPVTAKKQPTLTADTTVKVKPENTKQIAVSYDGNGMLTYKKTGTNVSVTYANKIFTFVGATEGTDTIAITLSETDEYWGDTTTINVVCKNISIYGVKINKTSYELEYTDEAVGKTPAGMNFTTGKFNYGDWADIWFITDNKPLMLKSDGSVDYYLDPNDYSKKADGTTSDVSNTSYDGNAMAQIPLCWTYLHEDDNYYYIQIADGEADENYHAYAHTNANGDICDYFYWSLFGASGTSSKSRSIAGQTPLTNLQMSAERTAAQANGAGWDMHSWSQFSLLQCLCVLISKSLDSQTTFGYGNNNNSGSSVSACKTTGTLIANGQFYGIKSATNQQVKVFHIEKLWGDYYDRLLGLCNDNGIIKVKMTPEGTGYQVDNAIGYTDTGITISGTSGNVIKEVSCNRYGIIPKVISGTDLSKQFYDYGWYNNSGFRACGVGGAVRNAVGLAGVFYIVVNDAPSDSAWNYGSGLAFIPASV